MASCLMTWAGGTRRRWHKKYRGKNYAISAKQLGFFDKHDSRDSANAWWVEKQHEIDEQARQSNEARSRELRANAIKHRDSAEKRGNADSWRKWNDIARFAAEQARAKAPVPASALAALGVEISADDHDHDHDNEPIPELPPVVATAKQRLEQLDVSQLEQLLSRLGIARALPWAEQHEADSERTVGEQADRYLASRLGEVEQGRISPDYYAGVRAGIRHFADFLGRERPLTAINEDNFFAYHKHVLAGTRRVNSDEPNAKPKAWGAYQHKQHMKTAKHFIRWLWSMRRIREEPRNLKNSELAIRLPPPLIDVFQIDEIRTILANVTDFVRLCYLLMLNCGMTQKDIADLHPSEVDWKAGRITRKRSKTGGRFASVPTVQYALWPTTFALLKTHRSNDPNRVLLNDEGQPLLVDRIDNTQGKEKQRRTDALRYSFCRLRDKLRNRGTPLRPKLSLKHFRKTSSTLLASQYDRYLVVHFLGHAPHDISERHYIAEDQTKFDGAIRWLGVKLGIVQDDQQSTTLQTGD